MEAVGVDSDGFFPEENAKSFFGFYPKTLDYKENLIMKIDLRGMSGDGMDGTFDYTYICMIIGRSRKQPKNYRYYIDGRLMNFRTEDKPKYNPYLVCLNCVNSVRLERESILR